MTVMQKSVWGWLIGAGLGALGGAFTATKCGPIKTRLGGALVGSLFGALLIGSINDKRLECDPNYTGGS
jgi:hypothetical protein